MPKPLPPPAPPPYISHCKGQMVRAPRRVAAGRAGKPCGRGGTAASGRGASPGRPARRSRPPTDRSPTPPTPALSDRDAASAHLTPGTPPRRSICKPVIEGARETIPSMGNIIVWPKNIRGDFGDLPPPLPWGFAQRWAMGMKQTIAAWFSSSLSHYQFTTQAGLGIEIRFLSAYTRPVYRIKGGGGKKTKCFNFLQIWHMVGGT